MVYGDQLYSDDPEELSLITNPHLVRPACPGQRDLRDCSPEQIRRAFDLRYRIFWSMRPVQEMYANDPCYPAIDDHEIMDDWARKPRMHRRATLASAWGRGWPTSITRPGVFSRRSPNCRSSSTIISATATSASTSCVPTTGS